MDALRKDDLVRARSTPPGDKLVEALELMRLGVDLKRAALRERHPEKSTEDLEALLRAWLESDD